MDIVPIESINFRKNSDNAAVNAGYISIVPMNTQLNAGKKIRNKFNKLVSQLNKDLKK